MRAFNRSILAISAAALFALTFAARADLLIKDGSGADQTLFDFTCFTSKHCSAHVPINSAGTEIFTSGAPGHVQGTVAATQSGTWNITNISGTVSLPTGAATAAKQPALGTAGTPSADVISVQGISGGTAIPVSLSSVPSHAVTNAGTFAVQASQTGTWTVQPGNTANTTAWLVTGTGGTFPATQSGTWNITNISGTVSLPTGAATSANQASIIGTKAAGTAATNSVLVGGVYNTALPTLTNGQQAAAQFDASGRLYVTGPVTVASGGIASGAVASGAFASGSVASGAFASGSLASGAMVDFLTIRGTKAPGTAASNSALFGCVYTSAGVTLTDGQQAACQMTSAGAVNVNVVGATGLAQGSTTSGQTGSLILGAVTTAAPSYTNAQSSAFSLDTGGRLRTIAAPDPCSYLAQLEANVSITSATTTRVIAPSASNKVYICRLFLNANADGDVGVVEGTGGTCGTGTAALIGGTTAANGIQLASKGGVQLLNAGRTVKTTAGTNVDVCLITADAGPLTGTINYVLAP
jgi:hypothetical protein